jgi:hypothetical protein
MFKKCAKTFQARAPCVPFEGVCQTIDPGQDRQEGRCGVNAARFRGYWF